jgi:hypothetical protein
VRPFSRAPGHIIPKPAGRLQLWSLRQAPILSPCLGPRQPSPGLRKRRLLKRAEAEDIPGGRRQRQAYGREARAVSEHAGAHWPQRQLPCTGCAQGPCDPQAAGDVVASPYRTKRPPWLHRDRVRDSPQGLQGLLVAPRPPQGRELRRGTRTDIGKRAVEALAVSALRLAQQMPRRRLASTGDMRGVEIPSGYYKSICVEFKQGLFSL